MLDKIVVPLDGSPLSDRIAGLLKRLLVRKDAEVSLVQVLPADRLKNERVPGRLIEDARYHLDLVADPLRREGATVACEVLAGDPAERILLHCLERSPSLVVMATHGRTGVERFVRGSVAERVLRESRTPILLANPFGLEEGKDLRFKKILVPLDGSEVAAEILPLVREIALLYGAPVLLHFTIPFSPALEGAPPILMTDAQALALLEPFAKRLEGVKVELSTFVGDAASTILDIQARKGCDLIAMTTHGRTGWSRWLFGSVAEHVLRLSRCPILVKRVVAPPPAPAPKE